jgi:secreted trypsin-like serine protease
MEVYTGLHDRKMSDKKTKVPIDKLIVHDEYKRFPDKSRLHNLAILRTANKINFTSESGFGAVKPIELGCDDVAENKSLMIAGWGAHSYVSGRPFGSQVPMKLTVIKLARELCRCYLSKYEIDLALNTICTSPYLNPGAICNGDSGGPLVNWSPKGPQLVGVASYYKSPCSVAHVPSVFTKVADYIGWILERMN